MANEIKFKAVGNYRGHSVKQNGILELNLGFKYEELTKTVMATQLLNENVALYAKLSSGVESLGSFMVKNISIDHDGNSQVRYNTNMDHAEANTINELARLKGEDVRFLFKATVEEEGGEDE